MEIVFIGLVVMGFIAIGGACLQNYTDSVLEQKSKQKAEDLGKVETLDKVETLETVETLKGEVAEEKEECCKCVHCTCNKQENKATENVIEDIDREI